MAESIRKFEFQVYDSTRAVLLDRFALDFITSPSGLGFYQDNKLIETKTVSYIVDRALKKKDIKITVEFEEPNSYQKVNSLRSWLAKHINGVLVLSYNDTFTERLMDIYVKDFEVTEIVTNYNSLPLVLAPLSPFYKRGVQKTTVTKTGTEKKYEYAYPYSYGGAQLINNEINNSFFAEIPLYAKINGVITNPVITLKDENNQVYSTVSFPDVVIGEGQSLIIDAINSQILFFDGTQYLDYYNFVDKAHQTFLLANPGKTVIDANFQASDTGFIELLYIQYTV